jgi:hypothetical protein
VPANKDKTLVFTVLFTLHEYEAEKEVLKLTLKPSEAALVTFTFTGHDELASELLRKSVTMAVFGTVSPVPLILGLANSGPSTAVY